MDSTILLANGVELPQDGASDSDLKNFSVTAWRLSSVDKKEKN
jgi:hypothetical protein